jgi:hypothetical protein
MMIGKLSKRLTKEYIDKPFSSYHHYLSYPVYPAACDPAYPVFLPILFILGG